MVRLSPSGVIAKCDDDYSRWVFATGLMLRSFGGHRWAIPSNFACGVITCHSGPIRLNMF